MSRIWCPTKVRSESRNGSAGGAGVSTVSAQNKLSLMRSYTRSILHAFRCSMHHLSDLTEPSSRVAVAGNKQRTSECRKKGGQAFVKGELISSVIVRASRLTSDGGGSASHCCSE